LNARILTHSRYAQWLSRLIEIPVDIIASRDWVKQAAEFALGNKPDLLVLDTFPWGLRGEWAGIERKGLPVAFVARRLKVPAYLEATGLEWNRKSSVLRRVIVSEPLDDDYPALLAESADELHMLSGRIRFSANSFSSQVTVNDECRGDVPRRRGIAHGRDVPRPYNVARPSLLECNSVLEPMPLELHRLLSEDQVWLVVHSGPREEVERLVYLAKLGIEREGKGTVAVVAPQLMTQICDQLGEMKIPMRRREGDQIPPNPPLLKEGVGGFFGLGNEERPPMLQPSWQMGFKGPHYSVFGYFPASRLYPSAYRVVTGAGYNAVAEMALHSEKWVPLAFDRRYDDQAGRLSGPTAGLADGSVEAARIIEEWL
jgi:hypothetical protein